MGHVKYVKSNTIFSNYIFPLVRARAHNNEFCILMYTIYNVYIIQYTVWDNYRIFWGIIPIAPLG